jgi:SAM-dependent methyltransferase
VASRSIYTSGEYLARNETWHEEDAPWKIGNVSRLLERNGVSPRSVCEVGTGSGEALRLLHDMFPDCPMVGFDISEDALAIARPKAGNGLSFELGSPFGRGTRYDLAMALDVFEHVPDYYGFLRDMTALAEWQVYNIPLDFHARHLFQPELLRQTRARIGHLHYFTRESALATLEDTGHEVVDSFCHSPLQGQGGAKGLVRSLVYRANPDLAVRLLGGFSMTVLCRCGR